MSANSNHSVEAMQADDCAAVLRSLTGAESLAGSFSSRERCGECCNQQRDAGGLRPNVRYDERAEGLYFVGLAGRWQRCRGYRPLVVGRLGQGDVFDAATAAQHLVQRSTRIRVGWAAGEVPRRRAFSNGLPPDRAGPFPSTRLSSTSSRDTLR